MLPQVFTGKIGVRGVPGNSIEFMISHDRLSSSSIDHAAYGVNTFKLLRALVDKVTYKNGLAIWVPVGAASILITHVSQ